MYHNTCLGLHLKKLNLIKVCQDICLQTGHSMMPPWLNMHCMGALETGTALMANDQIRRSTANSFMLRMICIVKLCIWSMFFSWSRAKNKAFIINVNFKCSCGIFWYVLVA